MQDLSVYASHLLLHPDKSDVCYFATHQHSIIKTLGVTMDSTLTLWTPEDGIPVARYINATASSRYTGGTVINATGQRPVYRGTVLNAPG